MIKRVLELIGNPFLFLVFHFFFECEIYESTKCISKGHPVDGKSAKNLVRIHVRTKRQICEPIFPDFSRL